MSLSPRVLIVRFSSLGDVVLTTPLLRAIRARHPRAHVTVVVAARYLPLLERNPAVTCLVALRPQERMSVLARQLAATAYDYRLDLQDSARSRRLRQGVPGAWRVVNRRRAARALLIWLGIDAYGARTPVAEQYFEAASPLDVSPDGAPAEVFPSSEDAERAGALAPSGCVVLSPGASRASKRWPPAYWRELATRLLATGLRVVAVGSDAERQLLVAPGVVDAYGLSLGLTAAILKRSRVVVANDSGLLHLATAVARPVVVILGPTVGTFGYLPYGVPSTVVERPIACRPCSANGSDHCPLGHHRCMIDISPGAVAAAIARVA